LAKRFTDTEKWKKQWYRTLGSDWRDIWTFITDNCDHAGIWEPDFDTLEYFTGHRVSSAEIKEKFAERIEILPNGKLYLTKFIDFQYKGELNHSSQLLNYWANNKKS
jgi:hypothetical protein